MISREELYRLKRKVVPNKHWYWRADGEHINAPLYEKTNYNEYRLLHFAAMRDSIHYVTRLLDLGADVNICTFQGVTPLHIAAIRPKGGPLVELLVSRGADVTARDEKGRTPLHMAAEGGRLAAAKFVVSEGANPHAKTDKGFTPLEGVRQGRGKSQPVELMFYFLDLGVKPSLAALARAFELGSREAVDRVRIGSHLFLSDLDRYFERFDRRHLAAAAQFDQWSLRDREERTLLHAAVHLRKFAAARRLLRNGVSMDSVDKEGFTVFQCAVKERNRRGVRWCLRHGAVAHADALCQAAEAGDIKLVKLFVKLGVDVNERSRFNQLPILSAQVAPWFKSLPITRFLLSRGADPNKWVNLVEVPPDADGWGERAIHLSPNVETVQLLHKYGADLDAKDDDGLSRLAYESKREGPNREILQYLTEMTNPR